MNTTHFTDETGEIITVERRVPNHESLSATQEPLNSVLVFTQSESPLYRCASVGSLVTLFAIHAFYEKMLHLDDKTRLIASQQMRDHLATLMERVIQSDANQMKEEHPNDKFVTTQLARAVPHLISNIHDPKDTDPKAGLIVDETGLVIGELFSKLISNAKQDLIKVSSEEQALLATQQDEISLAGAYKIKA